VKLVVDTNVLVSGSLWGGNSARLIDALLAGRATLCLSSKLLAELEDVLQREKFHKRLEEKGKTVADLVSLYRAAALTGEGSLSQIPSDLRDPDDVHVLACAVSCDADAIVTGDLDLFSLILFQGIPIVSVREALQQLGITTE
jgi:uncharacterized protein